jgi:hypothetical protein
MIACRRAWSVFGAAVFIENFTLPRGGRAILLLFHLKFHALFDKPPLFEFA